MGKRHIRRRVEYAVGDETEEALIIDKPTKILSVNNLHTKAASAKKLFCPMQVSVYSGSSEDGEEELNTESDDEVLEWEDHVIKNGCTASIQDVKHAFSPVQRELRILSDRRFSPENIESYLEKEIKKRQCDIEGNRDNIELLNQELSLVYTKSKELELTQISIEKKIRFFLDFKEVFSRFQAFYEDQTALLSLKKQEFFFILDMSCEGDKDISEDLSIFSHRMLNDSCWNKSEFSSLSIITGLIKEFYLSFPLDFERMRISEGLIIPLKLYVEREILCLSGNVSNMHWPQVLKNFFCILACSETLHNIVTALRSEILHSFYPDIEDVQRVLPEMKNYVDTYLQFRDPDFIKYFSEIPNTYTY